MTCFAVKGCERKILEPFVAHLNLVEGTTYSHRECLYFADRQSPQPEELFVEEATERKLVIERKSIAWPHHYEQRHSNDHLIANTIFDNLQDVNFQGVYALRLPYLILGTKRELTQFSLDIAGSIRQCVNEGVPRVLSFNVPGRSWSFYKPAEWEIPDDAPEEGLVVLWGSEIEDSLIDPARLPDELGLRLDRIFESCTKKFQGWLDARKVLVLDQFGALRYNGDDWWQGVLASHQPPPAIDEVWLGIFDWLDDWTEDWIFERLWKAQSEVTAKIPTNLVSAKQPES